MTEETATAPSTEQQQAPAQVPLQMHLELPNDLLLGASQALGVQPQAMAQVLANVIGQMVARGLGVRVGPPPAASHIAIARGMPPAPRIARP